MRSVGFLIIAVAIVCRCCFLVAEPRRPRDLTATRDEVASALLSDDLYSVGPDGDLDLDSLDAGVTELGVDRIIVERFDSTAAVVMLPGADGQPGVAGVDDNGDAVVDNRSELGATRSDDVCVVASADEESEIEPPKLVLQRGAFVPSDQLTDGPRRYVVYGTTGTDRWSFLVDQN